MAELPEIAKLTGQMRDTLCGKTIQAITLLQEKCANIPPDEFQKRTVGARIEDVRNRGKWIITALHNGENILYPLVWVRIFCILIMRRTKPINTR